MTNHFLFHDQSLEPFTVTTGAKMKIRNMFISDRAKIDTDKMRDRAHDLVTGDRYNPPIDKVIIHFHAYGVICDKELPDSTQKHEYFEKQ